METFSVNSVSKVTKGDPAGSFLFVECNVTIIDPRSGASETLEATHVYRASDPHGLSPVIKQWLTDNPNTVIHPFVAPEFTPAELRETMPSLTARQFRLGLVNAGLTPAQVTAAIEAMPAGAAKEKARIEWEYATTFNRNHPLIGTISAAMGLAEDHVDSMWMSSVNL